MLSPSRSSLTGTLSGSRWRGTQKCCCYRALARLRKSNTGSLPRLWCNRAGSLQGQVCKSSGLIVLLPQSLSGSLHHPEGSTVVSTYAQRAHQPVFEPSSCWHQLLADRPRGIECCRCGTQDKAASMQVMTSWVERAVSPGCSANLQTCSREVISCSSGACSTMVMLPTMHSMHPTIPNMFRRSLSTMCASTALQHHRSSSE
jgi:hypothetical protein